MHLKPVQFLSLLSSLNHVAFVGMRFTVLLYAIKLGAAPATVGILGALFAALSAVTLVSIGRWADRIGGRMPMLLFSVMVMLAGSMVYFWREMAAFES